MKLAVEKSSDGGALTLRIEGSIDTVTAPELERRLNAELAGVRELVLDFSGVNYVSSAGLRVIMSAARTMNKQGSMVLKQVGDDVREVFEMTGFDELLTFESTK